MKKLLLTGYLVFCLTISALNNLTSLTDLKLTSSSVNMGPKPNLRSCSPSPGAASDTNEKMIDMLMQIQQSINTGNNLQQQTLNALTQKVDSLQTNHGLLKDEVDGASGLKHQLSELQERCGDQEDRMAKLEEENKLLRRELSVIKNIVVHTTNRVGQNESQITDLKVRSMDPNILVHGITEADKENLSDEIQKLFDENLGLTGVTFAAIHRMGKPHSQEAKAGTASATQKPKPRIIVARLANPEIKHTIFSKFKAVASSVTFKITNQYPEELRDARSRLYHVKEQYEADEVECEFKGSKLMFKDSRSFYREKVSLPTAETLMSANDPDVKKKLDKIIVHEGVPFRDKGNYILSYAATVKSYKQVSDFATKVLSSDSAVPANSNVLVYYFKDSNNKEHEGWCNDREYGAGLNILKFAKTNKCENFAVILSRKLGEHLGIRRHQVFQENAYSAISLTQ